jgi:hypothetical protein
VALSASADVLHSVSAFAQSPLRPGVLDDITDVASVAALRKQVRRARAQSFDTTSASRAIATARARSRRISGSTHLAHLAATHEVSRTSRPASRRARTARRAARRADAPIARSRRKKRASFFSPSMDRFFSPRGARHTARLEAHSISPSADTPPL